MRCPNCQAEHPENTIFCGECGFYLSEDNRKETDLMAVTETTWMEGEETGETPGGDVTASLGLTLTIPDSQCGVEVPLTKEGVSIGRLDRASSSFPDVDLTDYGGAEEGVSRRHAKIVRRRNEVFIEDLGSFNGTFLNGKKLTPHRFEVLKSGDELKLGKLVLRVTFTTKGIFFATMPQPPFDGKRR